jgi:hypothetical protein
MTVVEDPFVAEAPDASGGRVFGDGFEWCPDDSVPRRFDPVTDVAFGDQMVVGPEWMQAVVEHCAEGLALLERIDPSGFDAATITAWADRCRAVAPSGRRRHDRGRRPCRCCRTVP